MCIFLKGDGIGVKTNCFSIPTLPNSSSHTFSGGVSLDPLRGQEEWGVWGSLDHGSSKGMTGRPGFFLKPPSVSIPFLGDFVPDRLNH